MASLTDDQALERIKKPKNKAHIDAAVYQEERLLMHCESILEKNNLPFTAFRNFTGWWKGLITKEKWSVIDSLIGTPLSTLTTTKEIFDQLSKFIDAQDRYIAFKFTNIDYTNDYANYLERIKDDSFWRQRSVEGLKSDICSVVVVDLPTVQTTERPEPYKYFVSPKMFIDLDINRTTGDVEYFIYRQSLVNWDGEAYLNKGNTTNNKLTSLLGQNPDLEKCIVLDDDFYRVYVKKVRGNDWVLASKTAHELGFCPAVDFWQPSIKGTNGINKKGPITNVLKKLDYLLFYRALADYISLYGPFPPLVTYDMSEDMLDDKSTPNPNTNATIDRSQNSFVSNSEETHPNKAVNGMIGPGSVIEVPVPASKDDHDFMANPMKFVGMDTMTLEYIDKKIKLLESEIIEVCTGEDDEYMNEVAKNPEMLAASFESKETIFGWIKRQVERVHRFTTITQAKLRYGNEYFVTCTVDYGSDYNLKGSGILTKEFKEATEAGMPSGYTNEISTAASNTRFKNNPEILARMRILQDLEPYIGYSCAQLQLAGVDKADTINFVIKLNFNSFIKRFELENGSIVNFGSLMDYSDKIKSITETLKEYGQSVNWKLPEQPKGQLA